MSKFSEFLLGVLALLAAIFGYTKFREKQLERKLTVVQAQAQNDAYEKTANAIEGKVKDSSVDDLIVGFEKSKK